MRAERSACAWHVGVSNTWWQLSSTDWPLLDLQEPGTISEAVPCLLFLSGAAHIELPKTEAA